MRGTASHDRIQERPQNLGELCVLRQSLVEQCSRSEAERDDYVIAELLGRAQEVECTYQVNQAEMRRRNPRYAVLTQPEVWEVSQM